MPRPCPLCHASRARLLGEGEDFEYGSLPGPFRMWRCEACGHGYLDPLPRPDQLGEIYPSTYYTVNPDSPIHFDGVIYETKMRRDVDRILRLAGPGPPHSVVDVGCGDGARLVALRERLGPDALLVGVDFQPPRERAPVMARHGIRMVRSDVEDGLDELPDDSHDLVILCQMIEHVRDPVGVVATLAKKLSRGGRMLLETPNQGGPGFRLFRRRYWGGYHFPRHFHLFTRETLERLAGGAGLRILDRGYLPSGFGIASLRNWLGLSSIRRSRHPAELLHMRNLAVVGAKVAFDLAWIGLGGASSNQYLLAEKP